MSVIGEQMAIAMDGLRHLKPAIVREIVERLHEGDRDALTEALAESARQRWDDRKQAAAEGS